MSKGAATWDADYGAAVLHLVWDVDRKTKDRVLLCGAIELLPHEVPPPLPTQERCLELSRKHILYAADVVLPVAAALRWYTLAKAGAPPRPTDGTLDLDGPDRFVPVVLDEEPEAPLFSLARRAHPFGASWHCCARTRHLIARTFRIEDLWTVDELERAHQWFSRDIDFGMADAPEFWGAVHLIAPNPVFRSIAGHIDRTKRPPGLTITIDYRIGGEGAVLNWELDGVGPTGPVFTIRRQLRTSVERIQLPCDVGELYERVIDADRGLLYELGPFTFLGSINTTLNLVSETRHVSVSLADGSAGDFHVPLDGSFKQSMTTGTSSTTHYADRRLRQEAQLRERRRNARKGQRWYRDQVPDATLELRSIVGRASTRLMVADPYFSGEDVLRILAAATDPSVPIQVLVGGDHLRSRQDGVEHGDLLEASIAECQDAGRMNPISVRVMSGSPPPLHDRLVAVDDEMWMLGLSLNAFGSRGTMLLRVLDPTPVMIDVQRLWDDAQDFGSWLTERRAARSDATKGG